MPEFAAENRFLDALPAHALSRVLSEAERLHVPLKQTIYEPGAPVADVYFPIDAVISVVNVMRDGSQVEALTVGREGFTGAQALLTGGRVSQLTWCQVGGEAYRIGFAAFADICAAEERARKLADALIAAQWDTMAQSIACNRLHLVTEACARWLLMTRDRVGRDEFNLTHEALATMLGVRRAGVSEAVAALEKRGFIRNARGRFQIVDRAGLVSAACECYGVMNDALRHRGFALA